LGSCGRCGKPTRKDKQFCVICSKKDYQREYVGNRYQKKKRFKKCLLCETPEKVKPFVGLCNKCYQSEKNVERVLRENEG
jgi:hypothetical protein